MPRSTDRSHPAPNLQSPMLSRTYPETDNPSAACPPPLSVSFSHQRRSDSRGDVDSSEVPALLNQNMIMGRPALDASDTCGVVRCNE